MTLDDMDRTHVTTSALTPVSSHLSMIDKVHDGARVTPVYTGDMYVRGAFDAKYNDAYVYVYVNEDFKAFSRVKSGSTFDILLSDPLEKGDEVYVDIAAYNSNKTFSSPTVTVLNKPDYLPLLDDSMTVGPFEIEKKLVVGDQSIRGTFPKMHKNSFVYVYVNDKYYGSRQVSQGNVFFLNLKNPLQSGDEVKIKLYSYTTRVILEGLAVVD